MIQKKSMIISGWFSVIAVVLSIYTLYETFLRDIEIDMAVGKYIYISNTIGGIPDIYLHLVFYAEGPPTKNIVIHEIRAVLEKEGEPEKKYELVNNQNPDNESVIPMIIKGGNSQNYSELLIVDEFQDIAKQIKLTSNWYDNLARYFPEKRKVIEGWKNAHRGRYIPNNNLTGNLDKQLLLGALLETNGEINLQDILDNSEDRDEEIGELLKTATDIDGLYAFGVGSYSLLITAVDPTGNEIVKKQTTFRISDTLSNTMKFRFNQNVKVELKIIDPEKIHEN